MKNNTAMNRVSNMVKKGIEKVVGPVWLFISRWVGLNGVGFGNAQFGQQMAGKTITKTNSNAEQVQSPANDDNETKPAQTV
ncbi:MAG: hypothetical protein HRT35_38895 [Algicola sp.]|nr:hypothetical protein [Algicola sp.]